LDFKIEPKTLSAIKRMSREIHHVSPERIRDELIKLFTGPHPDKGMDWLDRSGLLKEILPEISALKGVQQPKQFHPEGDVYKHTRLMLSYLNKPDIVLAFGSLLHDIGKPRTFKRKDGRIRFNGHDRLGARMADQILSRLKFSNEHKRKIIACVEWHMQFKDVKQMRQSRLKRMFQRETFLTEMDQHRADCLASHKNLGIWRFLKRVLKTLSQEQIKPDPFIKGQDLINLGLKPGPQFGKILGEAEEKQLEGDFKSRMEALEWLKHFGV
jgi:poly(A) polymerase